MNDIFLSGSLFRSKCRYNYIKEEFNGHLKKPELKINDIDNNYCYCITNFVEDFLNESTPNHNFVIVTGQSDRPITQDMIYLAEQNPYFQKWYGINIAVNHPKVKSIPIGINNGWYKELYNEDFGDHNILKEVIEKNNQKTNHIYVNFNVGNNFNDRMPALSAFNIPLQGQGIRTKPYRQYLEELSSSYFCLAPNGVGIDTHRLWESLYVKTIPIVSNSINVNFYKNLPIIIVDNWNTFDKNILTKELYETMMKLNNFDFKKYTAESFLEL